MNVLLHLQALGVDYKRVPITENEVLILYSNDRSYNEKPED